MAKAKSRALLPGRIFTEEDIQTVWPDGLGRGESFLRIFAEQHDLVDDPLWYHKAGLYQTSTGYGSQLVTSHKINFEGRLYRVYCTCWSNAGTCWFKSKGRKIVVS